MTTYPTDGGRGDEVRAQRDAPEIYVVPARYHPSEHDERLDLVELISALWSVRWWIVLATSLIVAASVALVLSATEWFRAEVLLAPASEQQVPANAGIGGLAALAGVSIGSRGNAEPLAVLQSREFVRQFIEAHGVLDEMYPPTEDSSSTPDIRDAVYRFRSDVLRVREDRETGHVVVSIEWTDPAVAADWANAMVMQLNSRMRERSLGEAEANVAYLQSELSSTGIVTLQQSIGRLLETELQKLMLARGSEEFSFRIIDPAEAPQYRSRPKRTLTVALAAVGGGLVSSFVALLVLAFTGRLDRRRTRA